MHWLYLYRPPPPGRYSLGPGLALSFDDAAIEAWTTARPLLLQYGARVTFFVTRYHLFTEEGRAQLRDFAADGHEIAAHGVAHLRAPVYVEEYGLSAYLADEALPNVMRKAIAHGLDL